jgi:hypothetical protein
MVRIALAVAVILTLASSGANAQSQPPGAQPPGAQMPEAQPPGAQPPGTQPPGTQLPEAQPPGTQPPTARQALAVCQPDLAQFCGDVRPGGGRIKSCIKENWRQLSPGCKQALLQARQARQQQR